MSTVPVDLKAALLATLQTLAESATASRNVILAHENDDAAKMLESMRPNHADWPKVEKLQAQIATLLAAIDAANAPNVEKPSEEDVAKARESLAAVMTQAKASITLLETIAPEAKDDVPEVLRKRAPSVHSASGNIKRPRVSVMVIENLLSTDGKTFTRSLSKDAEKANEKATFTNAAAIINANVEGDAKVDVQTLQNHYFQVAGISDGDTSKITDGTVHEFAVTVGDRHFNVRVTK